MANFCIPKSKAEALKKDIKALGFSKFAKMNPADRLKLFEKRAGSKLAGNMEETFSSALAKNDMMAIEKWARKNLKGDHKKEVIKNAKKGLGSVEDLVDRKYAGSLTEAETKKFVELGEDMKKAYDKVGDNLGDYRNPEHLKSTFEYLDSVKKMNDYTASIQNQSALGTVRGFVGSTWKSNLLMNASSAGLNIFSTGLNTIGESVMRRLQSRNFGGVSKKGYKDWQKYQNFAQKAFQKYDFDVTRSHSIDPKDAVIGAGRMLGEDAPVVKSEFLKKYNNISFKYLLGTADVEFGGIARYDSANILSKSIKKRGEKNAFSFSSNEAENKMLFEKHGESIDDFLLHDSLKLNPTTELGRTIKEVSIEDARQTTYTNEGHLANAVTWTKQGINKATGGVGGELMVPFGKTPSNVIGQSSEYAIYGAIPKAGELIVRKFLMKQKLSPVQRMKLVRPLLRGSFGATATAVAGYYIASTALDYMPSYDPRMTQEMKIKNGGADMYKTENGNWVSMDAVTTGRGMLKYFLERKFNPERSEVDTIAISIGSELSNLPVVDLFKESAKWLSKLDNKEVDLSDIPTNIAEFLVSGSTPAFMNKFGQAIDGERRNTKTGKYKIGTEEFHINLDKIIAKIPLVRESLSKDTDIFGRIRKTGGMNAIYFGERFKKGNTDPLTNEYTRLEQSGNAPKFNDITWNRSDKVSEIEKEIGKEKLLKEKNTIGQKASKTMEEIIKTEEYKKLENEDKKDLLIRIFNNERDRFLYKHGKKKNFEELDALKVVKEFTMEEKIKSYGNEFNIPSDEVEKFSLAEKYPNETDPWKLGELYGYKNEHGNPKKATTTQVYSHLKRVAIINGENPDNIEEMPKGWKPYKGLSIKKNKSNEAMDKKINNPKFKALDPKTQKMVIFQAYKDGAMTKEEAKYIKEKINW